MAESAIVGKIVDAGDPADDFEAGEYDRYHEPELRPAHNAQGRFPVTNRHVKRHGRGNDGKIENEQRQNRQRNGDPIIQDALVFQIPNPAFTRAAFQAGGTKVLSVQVTIAQGAEEPATGFASYGCSFLRVKKTTRLTFHQDQVPVAALADRAEKGWKNFNLELSGTARAGSELKAIDGLLADWLVASGALQRRQTHSRSVSENNPGVANPVV
jgi:hypothetical protein